MRRFCTLLRCLIWCTMGLWLWAPHSPAQLDHIPCRLAAGRYSGGTAPQQADRNRLFSASPATFLRTVKRWLRRHGVGLSPASIVTVPTPYPLDVCTDRQDIHTRETPL